MEKPQIKGVFGVEDYSSPRNKHGLLEVECVLRGAAHSLVGEQMLPLLHGYHPTGPNSDDEHAQGSSLISSSNSSPKVGMPDLSLIRLPPPCLNWRLVALLLSQPKAIASVLFTLSLLFLGCSSMLEESNRQLAIYAMAVLAIGHTLEGLAALYICMAQLHLSAFDSCAWAGLVSMVGFPCTQWLLKLRPRRSRVKKA